MKSLRQTKLFSTIIAFSLFGLTMTSCSNDDDIIEPVKEGIQRSEITFTQVTGAAYPHGDHFHGLADAKDSTAIVVKFDANGEATENGHLHLDAEAVYRLDLKAWDHTGREVAADFIANETTANNYKAFLIGGDFILNPNTTNETGAIFQPRETVYGDGVSVTGAAGIGTTGILSYFSAGHDNADKSRDVTFVLRKLQPEVKSKITRLDWNKNDYANLFAGENVLELKFEIHAEHDHNH